MDYRLENLHDSEFEELICMICQKLLGEATTPFAEGKDGGRDASFRGDAKNYNGWNGIFVIQAKHTKDISLSCSDGDFLKNKDSIINKEIIKIKKLQLRNEIDNYILFTNRKLTGGAELEIHQHIQSKTGLVNVNIHGVEYINSLLRKEEYKDLLQIFPKLRGFNMPFEFYEKDIRDVIEIFHNTLPKITQKTSLTLDRPKIEEKNQINNLDQSYFENIILTDLNRYHRQILDFLENPINSKYAQYYEEASIELKRVIETNREKFDDFKNVFDFLTKYLTDKEPEKLKKYRNTIPAFFHFMYYQCDIGREK